MIDLPKKVRAAAKAFHKELPEFYETLADRLENADGMTAQDLFSLDAVRYNQDEDGNVAETPRGILSRYWMEQFIETGANYANTFSQTIPADDVSLLRLAQAVGGEAMPPTLRDLAKTSALIRTAKSKFISAISISVFAALLFLGVLIATPTASVPMLKNLYDGIPVQYYPLSATALFSFSDMVSSVLVLIVVTILGGGYFIYWSLPNLTGPLRAALDRWSVWELYRGFQGALFLSVLSIVVKPRMGINTTLSVALHQMRVGANPYKQFHIDQMIDRVDGHALTTGTSNDVEALNTGLIERQAYFYLLDVYQGQNLCTALTKVSTHIEKNTLAVIESRAKWYARILLWTSIGLTMCWAGWHLSVSMDFPDAMKKFTQAI